jgi:cytoskeletal protein CcmA (bactofilin family)
MLGHKRNRTVIAEGLKIIGTVTAEGLVEVNGQIEGELHCTSLIVSRKSPGSGTIMAEQVVVDGSGRTHSRRRRGAQIANSCCR